MSGSDLLGAVGLVVSIFTIIFSYYASILSRPESKDFENLQQRISGNGGMPERFRTMMRSYVAFFDRFYENTLDDSPLDPPFFSAKSLDRSLLIAAIYPIGFALIQWLITGEVGSIGQSVGLQPNQDDNFRNALFLASLLSITLAAAGAVRRLKFFDIAPLIFIYVWVASQICEVFQQEIPFVPTLFVCVVVLVLSHPIFRRGVTIVSIPVALFYMATILRLGPISAENRTEFLINIILFCGATASAMNRYFRTKYFGRLQFFLLSMFVVYSVIATATQHKLTNPNHVLAYLPLLYWMFIFPLGNAIFDGASVSLTRLCLRMSLRGHSIKTWTYFLIIDIVAALACFILIYLFSFLMMAFYNYRVSSLGGEELFAVDSSVLSLMQASSTEVWFWFALASTLLPTIIHIAIWCLSLMPSGLVGSKLVEAKIAPEALERGGAAVWTGAALLSVQWVIACSMAFLSFGALVYGLFQLGGMIMSL